MHHGHEMAMMDFSLLSVLVFGLLTSFGHCLGMCSGIVVAYSSAKLEGRTRAQQTLAHLLYALGRISVYAILGGAITAIGSVFAVSMTTRGVVLAALGLVMILIGISLLGKTRFLVFLENSSIVQSAWYKRSFGVLIGSKNPAAFYGIGLLNGLIPCGAVYAALAMALTSGSVLGGAGAMAVFGVATAPSLFAIGLFVGLASQLKFRAVITKLSAVVVIAMGCWTIYRAFLMLTMEGM
ncbi:membrane protein [Campylobacterota bacterium]|nr:membrane protein [Campylobacterota bacterium]